MKKMYKIATVLLAFCFLLGSVPMSVKAENYKYQVTIFSGKQGAFSGTAGLVVKGADYSVSNTADAIVIKDLNPGDTVSFEARSGAVALDKDSKYYVQGIRISGRDNNAAVENSSFEVTGDQEYVVAYGIKGDQVAYTINYQDANGNKLADSQTFYGNVGDKPVVAYTYIDGYTPEYRNLTKTLSANAAENVFTFNYLPYETVTVTTPGQTITNTTEQTVTVPGGTTTTTSGLPEQPVELQAQPVELQAQLVELQAQPVAQEPMPMAVTQQAQPPETEMHNRAQMPQVEPAMADLAM